MNNNTHKEVVNKEVDAKEGDENSEEGASDFEPFEKRYNIFFINNTYT